MNLFFFGRSSRQLFGAYHAPSRTQPSRGAALLCPPWGQEYLISHRTLRRLAERLSDTGYHVLRFDYYGTGDSAGDREEGELASWYDDATVALEELRDMSGCASVAVLGIRVGAVVGWQLASRRADVHTVVLWDPVVNGTGYVRELTAIQTESDQWLLDGKPHARSADAPVDLLGFPLTLAMRRSIEAVTPAAYRTGARARVHLFYSDDFPEQEALHHALRSAGTPFHMETFRGQTAWREEETAGAVLPVHVLDRLVEMMP